MLIILCKRLLKPNALTSELLIIQSKTLVKTFCSSESKPNFRSEQVITLLKSHGFTETQISNIARVQNTIFLINPQKTLAPKLEFFLSIGISKTDLPRILSANPSLLSRSLVNQLIPCHTFLKSVLINDENVVKMLKRSSRIFLHDVEKNIAPNISTLTGIGVPKSRILFMFLYRPSLAHQSHDKFKRTVEEAIRMGFNPMKTVFILAVHVLCETTRNTRDRKWAAYRNWGLSDDEILTAFRSHPICFKLSEEKIFRGMDFLVNKMGWEAENIAKCPALLFFNLENRIKPRCRVIKVLISEGILKKDTSLSTFLVHTENRFLERFVSSYEDRVPGLLNIYRGKTDCVETGI